MNTKIEGRKKERKKSMKRNKGSKLGEARFLATFIVNLRPIMKQNRINIQMINAERKQDSDTVVSSS